MTPSDGRRFTGADSSWWHMEEPTNQMAITAVLVFDGPLDEGRLRDLLGRRLAGYDRFHQRVEEGGPGRPRWLDDPEFTLDRHLDRVDLPAGAGRVDLERLVGEEMSRPLAADRPLWRAVYVDGYRGGSALVVRVHHCIADGLALVRILLTLDDEEDNEDDAYARYVRAAPRNLLMDGVGMGARTIGSLGRLVGMRPDPSSSIRGELGREKRAAWSRPFRLRDLHAVARDAGGTINDVVLSTIAGGLGRFMRAQGDRITRQVRAVVPVSLRRRDEAECLGNRFGLVFASLPIAIGDPRERLAAVHAAMGRLKRSPEAAVVYGLLEVFGRTPRKALDLAVGFLGSKATLVLTNVPGPRNRVRFCGRELESLIAWVPQSGRLGLGVSVLSYADEVRFGVAADAALVPDPGVLMAAFQTSADELLETVRVPHGMELTV
jgi:diacylglycerol O-acyltransferase